MPYLISISLVFSLQGARFGHIGFVASKVALSKHFDVLLPIIITTPLTHLSSAAVPFESIALHSKLKTGRGEGDVKPMGE